MTQAIKIGAEVMDAAFRFGPYNLPRDTPCSLSFVCWVNTEDPIKDCKPPGRATGWKVFQSLNDFVKRLLTGRAIHFVLCINQKQTFIRLNQ